MSLEKMEEYNRLMHALTIQTLDQHLNDSIVNVCIKRQVNNKDDPIRTSKRKSRYKQH